MQRPDVSATQHGAGGVESDARSEFWGQTLRAQFRGSMDGPELNSIHGEPLWPKSEDVFNVCSSDVWT